VRRTSVVIAVVAIALLIAVASTGFGGNAAATASPEARAESSGPTLGVATSPGDGAGPGTAVPTDPGASPGRPAVGTLEPLAALLVFLPTAPEDRAGYERSLFVHWIDADGDGCDTRHEVLIAEAIVAPTVGTRCSLSGGRWFSAYDGLNFSDPADLQIDHVVALAEAWDSGASAWTAARREAFANDLGEPWELIAVSAASNQAKSDSDPADWLPPASADECPFLSAWIATKVRWNLALDQRERDALATEIADCPGAEMPYEPASAGGQTGGGNPTPGPTSGGGPASGGACDPAYPTVCIAPPPPDLDCADVPYRNFRVLPPDPHRFDGDHDGIGCET
jgi:hypothetical protein